MLAHVLNAGSLVGRRVAAETLEAIISDNTKNQAEMLKTDALRLLVDLLRPNITEDPKAALDVYDAAVSTLLALMSSHVHHEVVAAVGARPLLQQVMNLGRGVKEAKRLHNKVMIALQKTDLNQAVASPLRHVATPQEKSRPGTAPCQTIF